MKKLFIFAMAFVASALVFTSCDNNTNKVDSPLVGSWRHQTDPAPDSGWFGVYIVNFEANSTFALYDYAYAGGSGTEPHDGFVWKGTYEIQEDIVTVHYEKYGMAYGDGREEFDKEYEPNDEQMKFRFEGQTLILTREYGTGYAWTAAYTRQ